MRNIKSFSTALNAVLVVIALLAGKTVYAAPVESKADIIIKAPMEKVWQLMVDVRSWPKWNPAVESVEMLGAAMPGNSFVWKSKGFTVTSTFSQIEPMKRITWKGEAIGTNAFHTWEFEMTDAGVVVHTHEIFDGWLPRLMPGTMQSTLDETLPKWLKTLKENAEKGEGINK